VAFAVAVYWLLESRASTSIEVGTNGAVKVITPWIVPGVAETGPGPAHAELSAVSPITIEEITVAAHRAKRRAQVRNCSFIYPSKFDEAGTPKRLNRRISKVEVRNIL
jgi:hypothetical protein